MVLQMIQVHLQPVPLQSVTLILPVHQVLVEIILVEVHLVVHLEEVHLVVHLVVALLAVVLEEGLPVEDLLVAVLEELKSKFIDGAIIIFLEI